MAATVVRGLACVLLFTGLAWVTTPFAAQAVGED